MILVEGRVKKRGICLFCQVHFGWFNLRQLLHGSVLVCDLDVDALLWHAAIPAHLPRSMAEFSHDNFDVFHDNFLQFKLTK